MNKRNNTGSIMILCAGGHSAVITDIMTANGGVVEGFFDDIVPVGTLVLGFPVLGSIPQCLNYASRQFVIATGDNQLRKRLAQLYDLDYATVVHPAAVVAQSSTLDAGTVVMAGAIINPRATVGRHCIVNTDAIVEHDNMIEDYVHLSPHSTLGGSVTVGECTHIGIGAVVKNNVSICSDVVVGAGAVVVNDIEEKGTYVGVPVRRIG